MSVKTGQDHIVSRWGGDEFVSLLLEVKQEADVTQLAEKMVNRIAEAYEVNGHVLYIKSSIGIAIYPADGRTADILFKNADTAMYKAKGSEKRVVLFRELGESVDYSFVLSPSALLRTGMSKDAQDRHGEPQRHK